MKGHVDILIIFAFPWMLSQSSQVIDFDTLESWSPAGSTAKAPHAPIM